MLQLNPTLPVYSLKHKMKGYAYIILDYSQDHDTLFLVGLENSEFWWIKQSEIRLQSNISLGIEPKKSPKIGDEILIVKQGRMFEIGEKHFVKSISENGTHFFTSANYPISVNSDIYIILQK